MSIFLNIAEYLNDASKVLVSKIDESNWYLNNDDENSNQWVLADDLYLQYGNLIQNSENPICLKIKKQLNSYVLEKKMLALELDMYLTYIYLSLSKNIFRLKFLNNNKTIELINTVDKNNIIDLQLKRKMAIVHGTFDHEQNYLVYIDHSLSLAWNDYILSTLARQMSYKNGLINEVSLPYGDTQIKTRSNSSKIEHVSLHSYIFELNQLGIAIYENNEATLNAKLFGEHCNNPRLDKFISKTFPAAVSINGTACSYKTTLINKCLSIIKNEVDPNSRILKIGKMGQFSGKDCNQILAMNYQYMTSSLGQVCYTSLFDRCKFNNTAWRIIMACLETTENPVDVALQRFMDFTPYLIQQMKLEPIIIVIDTDVVANRKRMRKRAKGGDMVRSQIENYVSAQNIVYGMLAYLCEWPIYPADTSLHTQIMEQVIAKTKKNVSDYSGKLPKPCVFPNHKLLISGNTDTNSYNHAKNLNILK